MKTNEKSDRRPDQKEKKSHYSVGFRWKMVQQIDAELLDERQACEKHGITLILIRNRTADAAEKIKALEKQLEQTQKALQDEKVKSRAYEIMTVAARLILLNRNSMFPCGAPRAKKAWGQTVTQLCKEFPLAGVGKLCQLFGLTRDAFYKAERRVSQRCLQEDLVLEEVHAIKEEQSRSGMTQLGTEKVYPGGEPLLIKPFLAEHDINRSTTEWGAISCMICCVPIICCLKENEENPVLRSLNTDSTSIPIW